MDNPPSQTPNNLFLRMLESEKFLLMGKMASGVAHEINNPIMIIQNYVSLILDEIHEKNQLIITSENEYYSYLQEILEECERISKITKNLLEFTRTKSNYPEITNIENLLLKVVKLMQPMIVKANIKLNIKINTSKPFSLVRSDQIQQVFVNLIDNSIFAIQKKSTENSKNKQEYYIEITVSEKKIQQENELNSYISVEFYDNGIGIEKNIQEHIFEPFVTTKKSKSDHLKDQKSQGLGLGLAYCKNIIQNHDGFIEFESKPSQFTRFTVYLPHKLHKIHKSSDNINSNFKIKVKDMEENNDETIVF
ncbi:MAG: sensor histidine kinase [Promethearchaeota archaeon]